MAERYVPDGWCVGMGGGIARIMQLPLVLLSVLYLQTVSLKEDSGAKKLKGTA
jgi:hypothetical protein